MKKLGSYEHVVGGGAGQLMNPFVPKQHKDFHSHLRYFAIGSLDNQGRPWASIISGKEGFIKAIDDEHVSVNVTLAPGDPFGENITNGLKIKGASLIGGVGVDFSNRRRNKLNGHVEPKHSSYDPDTRNVKLTFRADQACGNCPKYISIRKITAAKRNSTLAEEKLHHSGSLSDEALAIIAKADTTFFASRFSGSDNEQAGMDVNHRGGRPGFVRVIDKRQLVIPDYSGNQVSGSRLFHTLTMQFYQSLGNIFIEPVVGVTIPDFDTGDILMVTGDAKLLFDKEANAVMPRMNRILLVEVNGYVLIRQALPFEFKLTEPSPYSPPVRLLASESNLHIDTVQDNVATLINFEKHNDVLYSFTFKLRTPVKQLPGQYVILSFAEIVDFGYQHMSSQPSTVNDDRIRTWTISSAPSDEKTDQVTITIKRKNGGIMTTLLIDNADRLVKKLSIPCLGVQGHFTCFETIKTLRADANPKMLLLACGVGVTPFLSMIRGLIKANVETDVVWILQSRKTYDALKSTFDEFDALAKETRVKLRGKPSTLNSSRLIKPHEVHISQEEIVEFAPDAAERDIYLCGPELWQHEMKNVLGKLKVDPTSIKTEAYNF